MLRVLSKIASKRFFSKEVRKEIIGIDFGTSYLSAAIVESGQPKIIENNEGFRTTPFAVAFSKDGEKLVGSAAKKQSITNAENTFLGIHRLLGKKYANKEVQEDMKNYSFEVISHENGDAWVKTTSGNKFSPIEITSYILSKIKESAEGTINKTINEAVISVPIHFQEDQRQAIKEAAKLSGFNVKKFIDDPISACLAFGLNQTEKKKVLVFDFGGEGFDVSILSINGESFEVLGFSRENNAGGNEIDRIIASHLLAEFKAQTKIDIQNDKLAMQRVYEAAEKSKIELSTLIQSDVNLPYLAADASGPQHLSYILTRARLESLIDSILVKNLKTSEECVKKSGLTLAEMDEILLVGGIAKMPKVQNAVESFFGKQLNKSVSPDEAIAIGAAIHASVLQGQLENVVLIDISPDSFGIETIGGLYMKLIDKGAEIPVIKKFIICSASSNQSKINLKVYQGERLIAVDNKLIGDFEISKLLPSEKLKSEIEVIFSIDESSNMKIQTKELLTKKENVFTVKVEEMLKLENDGKESGLSEEKIKQNDEKRVKSILLKIELDELLFKIEKICEKDLKNDKKNEEENFFQDLIEKTKEILEKNEEKSFETVRLNLIEVLKKLDEDKSQKEEKIEEKKEEESSKKE